ncbi:MAG TPA: DUF72 domain-containing protein [Jatrophihabitans sp.]|nr:DUF72 domain-containing protein [Jatrophihabitans sp.]
MPAWVGISGWNYPPWRGTFYPPGLPHRAELAYAASKLNSIELNGSFYSLQRPASYHRWAAQTPERFCFSVKGSRFITHLKRLADSEHALPNFLASGPLALGDKLGPLLWQLPPNFAFDLGRIEAFLDRLPRSTGEAAYLARRHDGRVAGRAWTGCRDDRPLRHAMEVRHDSFRAPAFLQLLTAHRVAAVIADTAGRWPQFETVTADFVYVRLHGARELYVSGYTEPELRGWERRIRGWLAAGLDVFVYFDNDVKVRAPYDAMALSAMLREPGAA